MRSTRRPLAGLPATVAAAALLCATLAGSAVVPSWIPLVTPTAPPIRMQPAAGYSEARNRLVVFGGMNGPGIYFTAAHLGDVWSLANADGTGGPPAWTQLFPAPDPVYGAPSARGEIGGVRCYDEVNNRLILYGGNPAVGTASQLGDVWVLSNADGSGATTPSWTRLLPLGPPPPGRSYHVTAYDPGTNSMIIHGGLLGWTFHANVWVLRNANGLGPGAPQWVNITPLSGPAPSARFNHAATYDAVGNFMIISGGTYAPPVGAPLDVWILRDANGVGSPAWIQLFPQPDPVYGTPVQRSGPSLSYDRGTNRMILFGGALNGVTQTNEVWTLSNADGLGSTPVWQRVMPTSTTQPNGRDGTACEYGPAGRQLVVFGGRGLAGGSFVVFNDAWVLADVVGPPDADGDGIPDDEDAFPYDARFSAIDEYVVHVRDEVLSEESIPDADLKKGNRRKALKNKVSAVLEMIHEADDAETQAVHDALILEAIDKIENDLMKKTDGADGGNPKNDWVTTDDSRSLLYGALEDLVTALESTL